MSVEDYNCEKQIKEANALGNTLVTGLIGESVIQNKKNIKVGSSLGNLSDFVKRFRLEIDNLKSLQVGACSDILGVKEGTDYGNQKSIANNLRKIVDVLKSHVNHNARVVSKKELTGLIEQAKVIESLKDELENRSSSHGDELKKFSEMMGEIAYSLRRISTSIETVKTLTDQMQGQAVLSSAAVLYFSGCSSENGEIKMPY